MKKHKMKKNNKHISTTEVLEHGTFISYVCGTTIEIYQVYIKDTRTMNIYFIDMNSNLKSKRKILTIYGN